MRQSLQKIYGQLPIMTPGKCDGACRSGKCPFECCTISGCSAREARAINWHIIIHRLKLPLMKKTHRLPDGSYFLPNDYDPLVYYDDKRTIKCSYLTSRGCAIYRVRPGICRLFGTCTEMVCEHFPEEATRTFPFDHLVDLGLFQRKKYLKDPEGAKRIMSALMKK